MDFDQLMQNIQSADLRWLVPILAGLLIVVGGLLIGLVRGMSMGVIIALVFGGLMCLSPALLEVIDRPAGNGSAPGVSDVTESTAELAALNNDVIEELSRVVTTMRTALDGIAPTLGSDTTDDQANADQGDRFSQSLADTGVRLDTAIDMLTRSRELRDQLQASLDAANASAVASPR